MTTLPNLRLFLAGQDHDRGPLLDELRLALEVVDRAVEWGETPLGCACAMSVAAHDLARSTMRVLDTTAVP